MSTLWIVEEPDADALTLGGDPISFIVETAAPTEVSFAYTISRPTVAADTIVLTPYAEFEHTLTTLRALKVSSGSCTFTVSVNGTPIADWNAVSVTTVSQDVDADGGSPVTVAVGDSLSVTFASVSTALNFQVSIAGTRIL